ncbi:protein kinase domain-containing protein [Ditylenchus destructor]|nr:protein kinase domain-containing protein [Ditylenchus destructor]
MLLIFISLLLYRSHCGPAQTGSKPKTVKFGTEVYTIIESLGDRAGKVTSSKGETLLVKEVHFDSCNQNAFIASMAHLAKADRRYAAKLHQYYFVNCNGYMMFEFMPVGNMRKLLSYTGGKIGNEKAIKFFAINMVAVIVHMHSIMGANGYLKPDEDFVLDKSGEPVMSDFGYSRIHKKYSADYLPEYNAPEVLQGNTPTKAADWYSLGAFLCELITGRPPYSKEQLKQFKVQGWKFTPKVIEITAIWPIFGNQSHLIKSLLEGLLDIPVTTRLGAGPDGSKQVQSHGYFAGVNWINVTDKVHMSPPYEPRFEKGHFTKYDDITGNAIKELKKPILDKDRDTEMTNAPEIDWPEDKMDLD